MTGFYRFWDSKTTSGITKTVTIAATGVVAYILREQHAKQLNKQDYVKENGDLKAELREVRQQLVACQEQRESNIKKRENAFMDYQTEAKSRNSEFFSCQRELLAVQKLLDKCEQSKVQPWPWR